MDATLGVGVWVSVGTRVGVGVVVINVDVAAGWPPHATKVRINTAQIAKKRDLFTDRPIPTSIILILTTNANCRRHHTDLV